MLLAERGFGVDPQRSRRQRRTFKSLLSRCAVKVTCQAEQFIAIRAELDTTLEKLKACSNPIDRRNLLTALRRLLAELDKLTKQEVSLGRYGFNSVRHV